VNRFWQGEMGLMRGLTEGSRVLEEEEERGGVIDHVT